MTGKGYTDAGSGGPGYDGSYGGRRGGPCYGSIVAPINLGSASYGSPGGGAILLTVSGGIRNDGLLCADGTTYYSGSGGSINLTSGTLMGGGVIRANGGNGDSAKGGGGRVAVAVTNAGADLSGFTGTISAHSGVGGYAGRGGAGTVYLRTAADRPGRGTVLVDNNTYSGYTDVPPGPPGNVAGEVDYAPLYVTNAATLRLTNNFIVGDIRLGAANPTLDLGYKTLTVHARKHEPLSPGTVTNYGAIIWIPDVNGAIMFVR